MPRVNRLPRAIWLAETALFEWSCSLVQFCSTPATNLRHKWAVPFFFVCKNPATENDISLSDLRPAIAATSTVACSAARVGCERLTVESLRELRGSSFCSLRTSGRRRATGRRPALRQYLPWAVPHPGTNRALRRLTSEASWSRVGYRPACSSALLLPSLWHRIRGCASWSKPVRGCARGPGLCPRGRARTSKGLAAFGLGVGLLPRPYASALRSRRGERCVRSFCLRPAIAATSAVACRGRSPTPVLTELRAA